MISLNLLSDTKKEEIKLKKIYLVMKDSLLILLLFSILIAIVLSSAKIILINTFNETVFSTSHINVNSKLLTTDLKNINQSFLSIKKIQQKNIYYDDLLADITKLIPKNVKLIQMSVNTETKEVIFKGIALERNDLKDFQKNLDESGFLTKIESPIANFLEKANVNFDIKATLALDKKQ